MLLNGRLTGRNDAACDLFYLESIHGGGFATAHPQMRRIPVFIAIAI